MVLNLASTVFFVFAVACAIVPKFGAGPMGWVSYPPTLLQNGLVVPGGNGL